ncbi:MAG: hypothetical protein KIT58_20660, partial [Planctomycetota bacterium]|nr:hypothetical protein [Planctomycetota bacterium]
MRRRPVVSSIVVAWALSLGGCAGHGHHDHDGHEHHEHDQGKVDQGKGGQGVQDPALREAVARFKERAGADHDAMHAAHDAAKKQQAAWAADGAHADLAAEYAAQVVDAYGPLFDRDHAVFREFKALRGRLDQPGADAAALRRDLDRLEAEHEAVMKEADALADRSRAFERRA